jgi:hypothetical protein
MLDKKMVIGNAAALGVLLLLLALSAGCSSTPTPSPGSTPTPPPLLQPTPVGTRTTSEPTPPRLPPVLQLTAQSGDTVVTLTWQPILNVRGYYIYRDDSQVPLNEQPLTGTTFEDIGLTNGRTYRYSVAAMDPNGEIGPRSAPTQATPHS